MPSYAYLQKQFIPLEEAKIGIMTNAFHYGTAIFEGIRGNWNTEQQQTYIFRLKEHYERLEKGCRMLNITLSQSLDELCQITVDLVAKCGFQEDAYIRPVAYKSSQALGVRLHDLEDDFFMFVIPWGGPVVQETPRVVFQRYAALRFSRLRCLSVSRLIFSSAENRRRVRRRISLTTFSAVASLLIVPLPCMAGRHLLDHLPLWPK